MGMRSGNFVAFGAVLALLAACGGTSDFANDTDLQAERLQREGILRDPDRETIWDLFGDNEDPSVTVEVNSYLWQASLEILDFMPLEAADPFTGIIAFGYATPPGGNRAYRATVYVSDPALEARSLRVALQGRNGTAVSRATARQVEDAILTRARQLRVADGRL
ncbi:DUF3576 domain-containing protein [Gymnodinialimonas hymeniacidonis]|uniref:DUF3576 domain-containing protein n=1 Tax=Gymnodinialimonas hymeniacidonis TaxID=3126508 RepID=UPI0034C6163F